MLNRSKRCTRSLTLSCLGLVASMLAGSAQAALIDFESIVHGEIVNSQIPGITIVADNVNRDFELAVGFDSNASGTSDEDLEAATGGATAWSGGNLEGVDLGTMLILQENDDGCEDGVSLCSDPDDEGRRPAGTLSIIFDVPVLSFGFDIVDIDRLLVENGEVVFSGVGGSTTLELSDLLAGFEIGNNTANRIDPLLAEELNLLTITQVDIRLGGSGAIDNLNFTPVPEPGAVMLLGTGLALLAVGRRKRIRARA